MVYSKCIGLISVSKAGQGWVYICYERKKKGLRVVSALAHKDLKPVQLSQEHFGVSLEGVNTLHPYFHLFICWSISVQHHITRSILACSFSNFVVAVQVNFTFGVVMAMLCRNCLYKMLPESTLFTGLQTLRCFPLCHKGMCVKVLLLFV